MVEASGAERQAFILSAFFFLLLVILGAQFSCGHRTTCSSSSTRTIANAIEANQAAKTLEGTNLKIPYHQESVPTPQSHPLL
jgi:hypothetical protein